MAPNANILTVGLVQMTCVEQPRLNLDKAVVRIEDAAARGAQVVCLQELFASRYFCQTEDVEKFELAESIPGPSTQALARLAAARKVVIVASLFERRAAGVYHNTAAVIDASGAICGRYRKMHIPDDPRYYEKFYFTPGDLGFLAHPTAYGSVGVLVCWDQWFPEAARLTAMSGAPVIFYPTAIGWDTAEVPEVRARQIAAWETVQRGHAIANGVFVAAVNRVGVEDGLEFWGNSFVCDPFGEVIARASTSAEETMVVQCDLRLVEETRRNWPFLRDRRIDAYGDLTRRLRSE
ncbi:MAG TPA: carbon-nitrogen hydrolase [Candidatus Binataceae bacterium]|jgi:N-carbamoylputrescine amidase|nr:carbon-nitrogen hydrolase [Candidatus Binataceae bacterium]